ncbi:hypothetical protein KHQ82_07695 [Mycoplasmatota bacterium]|nr:hypothetical protein KHQ82_07695 [Mycoplasmatota bacterium]
MKQYIKERIWIILLLLPVYLLIFYITIIRQDYEILMPGDITPVEEKVFIENGYEQEGSINSVFVYSLSKSTVFMNKFAENLVGVDVREMNPSYSLLTPDEIRNRGKVYYDTGMQYSIIHAYKSAGNLIEYDLDGLLVSYIFKDTIQGDLEIGDKITAINGYEIEKLEDISLTFDLDEVTFTTSRGDVILKRNENSKFGFIIRSNFDITKSEPNFEIEETSTMGSSGGLLQTLSLFNQLTEFDYTYGLKIAGTGSITDAGDVLEIGGVRQKVLAADRKNVDIFFVPSENYEVAKEVWNKIKTDMKLVKVDTFIDAINYLIEYGDENA